jgi:hypothetical protein
MYVYIYKCMYVYLYIYGELVTLLVCKAARGRPVILINPKLGNQFCNNDFKEYINKYTNIYVFKRWSQPTTCVKTHYTHSKLLK